MAASLLEVGRVAKPHGLTGEVVVDLLTNRLERLAPGSCLHGARDVGDLGPSELEIASSRPHQGRYLVRFVGVEGREAAEALRGVVLYASAVEDPEALFVHDLIGAEVIDALGARRGVVTAVEANPASDLLVIDGTILCPLHFVVAHEPGRVVVDVPEGIF